VRPPETLAQLRSSLMSNPLPAADKFFQMPEKTEDGKRLRHCQTCVDDPLEKFYTAPAIQLYQESFHYANNHTSLADPTKASPERLKFYNLSNCTQYIFRKSCSFYIGAVKRLSSCSTCDCLSTEHEQRRDAFLWCVFYLRA